MSPVSSRSPSPSGPRLSGLASRPHSVSGLLREGPVQLEKGLLNPGAKYPNKLIGTYLVIEAPHGDEVGKMTLYDSEADMIRNDNPTVIPSTEIRLIKVTDDGIVISTSRKDWKLHMPSGLEDWVQAFRAMCQDGNTNKQVKKAATRSFSPGFKGSSLPSPMSAGGPNRQGDPRGLNRQGDPRGSPRKGGMQGGSPWPQSISSPSFMPLSPDNSLGQATFASVALQPQRQGTAGELRPQWSLADLTELSHVRWLDSIQVSEGLKHHGMLGVRPSGQLVTGYFVLFEDRLDFWNRPQDAANRLKPCGRIKLVDVRSLEVVSGGFILNHKGRKMGLNVRHNDDLHDWSMALLTALAPKSPTKASKGFSPPGRSFSQDAAKRQQSPGKKPNSLAKDPQAAAVWNVSVSQGAIDHVHKMLQDATRGDEKKLYDAFQKSGPKMDEFEAVTANLLIRWLAKKSSNEGVEKSREEIVAVIDALDSLSHGSVSVKTLVRFHSHGAVSRAAPKKQHHLGSMLTSPNSGGYSHGFVPRVAMLSPKRCFVDPEAEALCLHVFRSPTDILESRAHVSGMSVDSCGHHPKAGMNIKGWVKRDVDEKLAARTMTTSPPRVRRESAANVALKITGARKYKSPNMGCPSGNMGWSKITLESQGHMVAPGSPLTATANSCLRVDGQMTKVGGEGKYVPMGGKCLTGKISDFPDAKAKADQPMMICVKKWSAYGPSESEPTLKPQHAGRTATGWADAFKESSTVCRHKTMQRLCTDSMGEKKRWYNHSLAHHSRFIETEKG